MAEKKAKETVKKATAKKAVKLSVKPLSVKQKLVKYLRSARVFRSLEVIYAKMNAKTPIEKAGVRGVLNRNFQDVNSPFERSAEERGSYRFRGVKKVEKKAA